ncbi:hypothetical protein COR50_12960 [Chitinophaga caeni]|uniref:Lipoprotein n=1 Tax=Chitinophaga caeni TaxID=2029983 RepID=A0A291QVQ0_9BACT|nr:hypothetical protein [Chitinophaga caeni]ATL48001.1 hypothetical protein COR50_12960 [Chitinophaga caeni]
MKKLLSFFAIALILVISACSKESSGDSKPAISFKEFSTDVLTLDFPSDYKFGITLNIQDKDGDIEDSAFVKIRFLDPPEDRNYQPYQMPELGVYGGKDIDAELVLYLNMIDFNRDNQPEVDSVYFDIFVKDRKGNYSDTITTPKMAYHSL